MKCLLETYDLTKEYSTSKKGASKNKVVDSVNIHVKQGDIYGLIGRNGAGKTTIMKMISGLITPTSGDFSLFGYKGKERLNVMHRIGTLVEAPGLYPKMSAYENLKLKCIAMGVHDYSVISKLLETVGLGDVGNKLAGKFSLGMKQRLGIAMALVGEPDLVILDEPINGLDPQGIAEIREIILTLNREKGITFIISSHILEELSKIATRYGIIDKGVILQELTNEELMQKCSERIEIKTDNCERACTILEEMGITEYKVVDSSCIQIFERLDASGEIAIAMAKGNVKTLSIQVKNEALEDYYLNLTGGNTND